MVESVGLRTSATVHRAIGVSDVKQVCVSLEQLSPRASICISVRSSKLLPIVYSACGLRTLEQSYRKVIWINSCKVYYKGEFLSFLLLPFSLSFFLPSFFFPVFFETFFFSLFFLSFFPGF